MPSSRRFKKAAEMAEARLRRLKERVYEDQPTFSIERRLLVKGWKYDPSQTFVSVLNFPTESTLKQERSRIGEEGLADWQAHITEVIMEERQVSDWSNSAKQS